MSVNKQEVNGLVDGMPGPAGMTVSYVVPQRYSRVETSGLMIDVQPQGGSYNLSLTSE